MNIIVQLHGLFTIFFKYFTLLWIPLLTQVIDYELLKPLQIIGMS